MDKLWVRAAKNQWAALEDFAQQLVNTPIKVETLPTQKPAA
jgi:hypothetical protein